jgi:hypothetical protein
MQVCFSAVSRGGLGLYITALLLLCCSFPSSIHDSPSYLSRKISTAPKSSIFHKFLQRHDRSSARSYGAQHKPGCTFQTNRYHDRHDDGSTTTSNTRRLATMEANDNSMLQECASPDDHPGNDCRTAACHVCPLLVLLYLGGA